MVTNMIILHYANISRNNASGVSVIVPQIMNAQTEFAQIGFYNYGKESFDTVQDVMRVSDTNINDDYHNFPVPFNHPDIVVFHSPFGMPRIIALAKMLKKDKIPYIIVPHGCFSGFAMKKKWLKKRIFCFAFMNRVIKYSAGIQYLSVGESKASVYDTKFFIVPNGIFVPEYVKKDRKKVLEISYIGRKDIYQKGLDFLIEACGIAKEQIKNKVRINIYGPASGCQMKKIRQLIVDYGVEDFVFDLPPVFGDDKKKVYLNTDVFVLMSRSEGQPVVILEAWSNGVPTLVTPGTTVSEECIANGCGWSVPADAGVIADKLIYLINNREEIDKNSQNAYYYAKKRYNWENVAKMYNAEYYIICEKYR